MKRTVTTINGARYRLDRELGRGGEGAVFLAENGGYAIKLLRKRSPKAREALADRLAMVSRLPIEDLELARPLDRLREPDLGYVMERFTGMVPIRSLIKPPPGIESMARWYLDGGGLRRRLRLLAHTADIFARLHGRGLVYTDPSPQNIFVSEATGAHQVRLIDTDNLRAASVVGDTLFTPGYGAPDLLHGRHPASSLSDAHAFSVIAFQVLALVHPLLGDLVTDGEPELEEKAFNGGLPWIDDPVDERNRSSNGIPRDWVLSRRLLESFREAFGEGLTEPTKRPGMAHWAEHLERAANNTLGCPSCTCTYYRTRSHCPWCGAPRPSYISADCVQHDPERLRFDADSAAVSADPGAVLKPDGKERGVDSVAIGPGETLELTARFTRGEGSAVPQLRLRYQEDRLVVEPLVPGHWKLDAIDGRAKYMLEPQGKPARIPLGRKRIEWFLRTGESNRLHRIIRFRQVPGGKA